MLDSGEVGVGPIVGDYIEDTQVENNEVVEEFERNNWGQTPKEIGIVVLILIVVFLVLFQRARN